MVNLKKGQNLVVLQKTVLATAVATATALLATVTAGLSWDVPTTGTVKYDVDTSVFLLKADGKVESDADFVFYNNTSSPCGSVKHSGDNTTGLGDGIDESVTVDFTKVPESVEKIVFVVTIHGAKENNQNFGQVPKASIEIVNDSDKTQIAKYDLTEDSSGDTAVVIGEFYRYGEDWKFKAVGTGSEDGLEHFTALYGVNA